MRRILLAKLNQDMKNGKRLAEERDSNKRKFADMEAHEQQVLEDWETGKIEKKRKETLVRRSGFQNFQLSQICSNGFQ